MKDEYKAIDIDLEDDGSDIGADKPWANPEPSDTDGRHARLRSRLNLKRRRDSLGDDPDKYTWEIIDMTEPKLLADRQHRAKQYSVAKTT